MKWIAVMLAGAAILATASGTEAASWRDGLYVGGDAGWTWLYGKGGFTGISDPPMGYDSDARFSATLGYAWPDGLRAEIEPSWMSNDTRVSGLRGGTTVAGALVNIAYDYDLGGRWKLTGLAGIGGAQVSHDIHVAATHALLLGGKGAGFAWQAGAGLTYALARNFDLGVEYRYFSSGDTGAVSAFAPVRFLDGRAQTVTLTLRWYPFREEAVAAPPPAPLPPAPPPPPPPRPLPPSPPPVKTFVVFFDFDKAALTPEAQTTVAEAAATVKQDGIAHILVTGHTDTVGARRYNHLLSLRRAEAVKTRMVQLGVPAGEIATEGRGFTDPLVATGPGVREPKNRRAVITLEP